MNPKIFAQLCADASKALALKDTTALGLGQPISIHGVDVDLVGGHNGEAVLDA